MSDLSQLDARTRALFVTLRQILIMALGAVEDYLGIPRSIQSKRKRKMVDNQKGRVYSPD